MCRRRLPKLVALAREEALARAMLNRINAWILRTPLARPYAGSLRKFIEGRIGDLQTQLKEYPGKLPTPSDAEVREFTLATLPLFARAIPLPPLAVESLRAFITPGVHAAAPVPASNQSQGAPLASPPAPISPVVRPPAPAVSHQAAPVRPSTPPFDWNAAWKRLGEFVVSGALLRGLLLLGAFMIVVSAAVLVIVYWRAFPLPAQLAMVAALPMSFYLGGLVLRTRLQLPIAGGVFTGIGALLVAVDFAAVYQLGGLAGQVDVNAYWLGASLVCSLVYALTGYRLREPFYGYALQLGLVSALVATTRAARLSPEWSLAAVSGLSAMFIMGTVALRHAPEPLQELIRTFRRMPLVLLPLCQFFVLFTGGNAATGQALTFAFAGIGYALWSWYFTVPILAHAVVWSFAGVWFFVLQMLGVPAQWYALALAVFAGTCIPAASLLSKVLSPADARRRSYTLALYLVGFSVLLFAGFLALVTLLFDLWAGVLALAAITLALVAWSYFLRRTLYLFLAAGLGIVPFTLAVTRLLLAANVVDWMLWLLASWTLLALAYLGAALLLRRLEGYTRWLVLWAHLLAPAAFLGLVANFLSLFRWQALPSLAPLSGVLAIYAASALLHDKDSLPGLSGWTRILSRSLARTVMLWPLMFLLLVWFTVAWLAARVDLQWLPSGYVVFALACIAAGERLKRRYLAYRVPCASFAFVAWFAALLLTFQSGFPILLGARSAAIPALLIGQLWVAGLTIVSARVYRSRLPLLVEPWLVWLPVTLFWQVYGAPFFARAPGGADYALPWLITGLIHLLVAIRLDRQAVRYAHGLYLGGYGLMVLSLLSSEPDRPTTLVVLGVVILVSLGSQLLVQRGRLTAFDDLITWLWADTRDAVQRMGRTVFLFIAAYLFPVWLAQLLSLVNTPSALIGLALTLNAGAYIVLGIAARHARSEFAWPFYSAGYALTMLGPLVAAGDDRVLLFALAVDVLIFAGSAYVFRRPFWLYLANALIPLMYVLTLRLNQALNPSSLSIGFCFLALVFVAIGLGFDRRRGDGRSLSNPRAVPFALPFYIVGYPLSALSLLIVRDNQLLVLGVFVLNALLYAWSAWAHRAARFLYPTVWLAAVSWGLALSLSPLPSQWHGLAWLPFVGACIAVGRRAFQRWPQSAGAHHPVARAAVHNPERVVPAGAVLFRPSSPVFLAAYALSLYALYLSWNIPLPLSLAALACSLFYFLSARLFRRAAWLYPGSVALHLALLAGLSLLPAHLPPAYVALPFLALTWAVALTALAINRRLLAGGAAHEAASAPVREYRFDLALLSRSWAQPFFMLAALDVLLWQTVALGDAGVAFAVAAGYAVLLGLFATSWADPALAYGALVFFLLAVYERLAQAGVTAVYVLGWLSAVGLGLYAVEMVLSRIAAKATSKSILVWPPALQRTAFLLTGIMALLALPAAVSGAVPAIASVAFAGTLCLTHSVRSRLPRLGYLGLALLEAAWMIALASNGIRQPQWYAIPGGLYFVGIGWLERRRAREAGGRASLRLAVLIEGFGLALLLLTAFIQSLGNADGFPYFVLLLVEALLAIWWGAAWRIKLPFFVGLGASVVNVIAQIIVLVNVYDINRFLVIFGAGILLVTAAVFVERQRRVSC